MFVSLKLDTRQQQKTATKTPANLSSSNVSPRSGLKGLLSRSQFDAVADTANAVTSCKHRNTMEPFVRLYAC